jgi:hypothetical protein
MTVSARGGMTVLFEEQSSVSFNGIVYDRMLHKRRWRVGGVSPVNVAYMPLVPR